MGACIRIPPPPTPIVITLPGGAKLTSQPSSTQSVPNQLDPLSSLFQMATPALGAVQPVFDIVLFLMAFLTMMTTILAVVGMLLIPTGQVYLSILFPMPKIVNTSFGVPIPGQPAGETTVPDLNQLISDIANVLCRGMKLVGLIPQLSMLVTVKDTMNASMGVMSGVQAKINSLTDALAAIPPNTGDPVIDKELDCAREAISDAMAHAMGPLSSLAPVMQSVTTLSQPITQGLPEPIINLISLAVTMNVITFTDDDARTEFFATLEQLKNGTLFSFPDFTNIQDIGQTMDEMRQKLAPILGPLETVQGLISKLQNC